MLTAEFGLGLDPFSVGFDQINEGLNGFCCGNAFLDAFLSDVEVDLVRGPAYVSEIGVRHFSRAVDDAAHDCDLNALEVPGFVFDTLSGRLEIEKGPAAGRAGDKFSFGDAALGSLEDVIGKP